MNEISGKSIRNREIPLDDFTLIDETNEATSLSNQFHEYFSQVGSNLAKNIACDPGSASVGSDADYALDSRITLSLRGG